MIRKFGILALTTITLSLVLIIALLLVGQQKMIFFPSAYGGTYELELPKGTVELNYETPEGRQRSFFVPPRNPQNPQNQNPQNPEMIWVSFSGNGSRALDWADFITRCPRTHDGFLLIEYPGYGFCEGSPSPEAIQQSAEKALTALGATLAFNRTELETRLSVLGHSIGCGAALNFAVHHPIRRVILVAPFTSLRDMARKAIGSPLCYLLRKNFDNRARLRDLAARANPPLIAIFHGADDDLIPSSMGRELSLLAPKIAIFAEVPNAGHNDVVSLAEPQIFTAMQLK